MCVFVCVSIHSLSPRPCSRWVQRSTRNGQRGWSPCRGKAHAEEAQLKRAAGSEGGRLKKPSEKRWCAVSFQGGWGLEFSEKPGGEAPAGSRRNKWSTGNVAAPQTAEFTALPWPAHWRLGAGSLNLVHPSSGPRGGAGGNPDSSTSRGWGGGEAQECVKTDPLCVFWSWLCPPAISTWLPGQALNSFYVPLSCRVHGGRGSGEEWLGQCRQ